MATTRSKLDESSSTTRFSYHVFLSFRGEETRKNFTDHLYTALVQRGIHVFRDDDEIDRGENIQSALYEAIQGSKAAIIVFSKDYASSRWCLDELVMIMERRRTVGLIVLPVFYHVNPSHVRKQTGSFRKAFVGHEKRFKDQRERVEHWRAALREAADLGGMVLENQHESQFIEQIVKEVERKVNRTVLNVRSHLVGMDARVKYINSWLQDGSDEVGVATIFGIGGIGKTTIAKTVFNQNLERFNGGSFLSDVKGTLKESKGLVRLQRQLLKDMIKGKEKRIHSGDEGIYEIKKVISYKKVLIVLDDVDDLDEVHALIGEWEELSPGSKIILTTRFESLIPPHKVFRKFEVHKMNYSESLQLFSWHAFGKDHPIEGYLTNSKSVVDQCGGLPLALQVLGSSLSGKSIEVWESKLQKLKALPDGKIQPILRVSYESLEDDHDRNLFLDIACFFVGKDKDYVVKILDGCDFYSAWGIQSLIDRCLLTVDKRNKLMMHQLIQDMGRGITREESPMDPGKRSRVWHYKDALNILRENTGTETVRGFALSLPSVMENEHGKKIPPFSGFKRNRDDDYVDKCNLSHQENCSKRRRLGFLTFTLGSTSRAYSFPCSDEVNLKTVAIARMQRLKLLQLNHVKLDGGYEDFPKSLVWLCWRGFPFESMPKNFNLERLVVLDMRNSCLKQVWKGIKPLVGLKILNLSHSHGLIRTPNFTGLPSLERLLLKFCVNLIKVDESIRDLTRLFLLNLKGCRNMKRLPRNITMLKSLEELVLSGCSSLEQLPEDLQKMKSLRVFLANGTCMNGLRSTLRDGKRLNLLSTSSWHSIFWSWVSPRQGSQLPSFSLALLPPCLVSLSLADCNISDNHIPNDLNTGLPFLQNLNLSGNPLLSLPESIKSLTMLKSLQLNQCNMLRSLPVLPTSLKAFRARDCTSLERIAYLPHMLPLSLDLVGCLQVVEVHNFFKLEPVTNNNSKVINSMGLSNLEDLCSTEVKIYNVMAQRKRKIPLQVLYEFGISSIFFPGNEVPSWFNYQSEGSSISFEVSPPLGHKIQALNLCVVYAKGKRRNQEDTDEHTARISAKSKGCIRVYSPTFYGIPELSQRMIWLSHWESMKQLKAGNGGNVSVDLASGFQVEKIGIQLLYEQEEMGTQYNSQEMNANVSAKAQYFVRHHKFPRMKLSLSTLSRFKVPNASDLPKFSKF
ncbi:disease resistance protein RPV1-like [Tripterygium wilfordii]|uniref:disease resistance protein RPV1-like n=1 Tax=Tripterygium wilfordii TaxID=458696 RepID=UPI0018F7E91E|nr:disease resistance protein RPV1-like [Tripterygium wilfordii]